MKAAAQFAYAQARLQARHGQRPGEQVWRQLEGVGDLANYLHVVRRSPWRHWVLGMNGSRDSHDTEQLLRSRFRSYVDEVAGWLPPDWKEPIKWVKRLPDLPALQYLLAGNTAPDWLLKDPMLSNFAIEHRELRLDAFRQSDCAQLAAAWQKGSSLPVAWLEHWQQLLPANALKDAGTRHMIKLYRNQLTPSADLTAADTYHQRYRLETQFKALFRRYSFQATAAFAHLGLVALDLEKLRSGLVRRAIFPDIMKAAS
ncbi:MAG TPA: hypothetical protein DDW55_11525 [Gammaproteobacteria bacterium]|nr:hypothetical protein [Gammaproteobacteria bacterium]